MLQSELDLIRKTICKTMKDYWGNRIGTFVVTENTTVPHTMLTIEIDIYNYFILIVTLEHSSLGFSVQQNGGKFSLIQDKILPTDLSLYLKSIDDELKLRIPDKFLMKNGWLK